MGKQGKAFTREEIEGLLDPCIGKTLGEIDSTDVFGRYANSNKGLAGDVIEQSVLGYPPDTRQYPDIVVDGVETEVKTTGVRVGRGRNPDIEAKEPMSITAVSIDSIWREEFETSTLWHKLANMLVVYYRYEGNKVPTSEWANFELMCWDYQVWTEDERKVLESDWTIVRDYIRGVREQHGPQEWSEFWPLISTVLNKQLMYMDTAPKYPNHPRFRLKRTVVTGMWRNARDKTLDKLRDGFSSYAEFDKKMHAMTVEYGGKTLGEIADQLGHTGGRKTKQLAEALVVRMFGGSKGKLNRIEQFAKMGLVAKSIALTSTGARTEDTKLWSIDFEEIEDESTPWEESTFRANFTERQILFIMFEEPSAEAPLTENRLLGFKRFAFPEEFVDTEVRRTWDEMRRLIFTHELRSVIEYGEDGKPVINPKSGTVKQAPNWPKSRHYKVFVRGTGTDASYKSQVVAGVEMLHQDVWVKGTWITGELAKTPFL